MDCGWLFVHRYDEKIRLFFFEAEQHLVIFGVQILWQDSTVSDQQRQHLALERILSWLPTSFLADGADDPLAGVADMQEFGRDEAAAGAGFAGWRAERFNGADDDIHHDVTSLQDVHRERVCLGTRWSCRTVSCCTVNEKADRRGSLDSYHSGIHLFCPAPSADQTA